MASTAEQPVLAHSEFRPIGGAGCAERTFEATSEFEPLDDQPQATAELSERLDRGERKVVLTDAVGTGKSVIAVWLIGKVQRPTLVMAPNKTLAAQSVSELRSLLPNNAVEYSISYYNYYQPEAYVAQTDTYIEKDSSINEDVKRLRHSVILALLSRRDIVVISSVSCIYGLSIPQSYPDHSVWLKGGEEVDRDQFLHPSVDTQYAHNNTAFIRSIFRVKGDMVGIIPAYKEKAVRVEFFGDEVDSLYYPNPATGDIIDQVPELRILPATHYVAGSERMERAVVDIKAELVECLADLGNRGKLLEAQRLRIRTEYDLETIEQVGFYSGIENYSRHIDGRAPGSVPTTLVDYFLEDFLTTIDESHVTVSQTSDMFEGDASRKRDLVDFGFRLPSTLDNRPLTLGEFDARVGQVVFVSATPGGYEFEKAGGEYVKQVIRPTGLVDPKIVVRPTEGQIDDLTGEI